MKKYILITDIIGLVGSLIIFILSIIREYYLWAIVILGIICLIWVFKLIYYYKNYILLNTNTNEQITKVYDEGNERFLSAQEAVDALNNK